MTLPSVRPRFILFYFEITTKQQSSGVQTGKGSRGVRCTAANTDGSVVSIVLFFYFVIDIEAASSLTASTLLRDLADIFFVLDHN